MATETLSPPLEKYIQEVEELFSEGFLTHEEIHVVRNSYHHRTILESHHATPTIPHEEAPVPEDSPVTSLPEPDYHPLSPSTEERLPSVNKKQKEINPQLSPLESKVLEYLKSKKEVKRSSIERDLEMKRANLNSVLQSLRAKLPLQDIPLFLINLSPGRNEAQYSLVTPEDAARIEQAKENDRISRENVQAKGSAALLSRDSIIMADGIQNLPIPVLSDTDDLSQKIFAPVKDTLGSTKISTPALHMVTVEGSYGELTIKQKDLWLYKAIQSGMSEQEIVEKWFQGNFSRYIVHSSSLSDSLQLAGLRLVRERGENSTFLSLSPYEKPKNKRPHNGMDNKPNHLEYPNITTEDISLVTSNPLEYEHLLPIDIRIFQKLCEQIQKKTPFNFEHFYTTIDPSNRFSEVQKNTLIKHRLALINNAIHVQEQREIGKAEQKLTCAVEAEQLLYPLPEYTIATKELDNHSRVAMAIMKDNRLQTRPLVFNGFFHNSAFIHARSHVRLFDLLFQNEPIPVTFALTRVGQGVDTRADLQKVIENLDHKLHQWNIALSVTFEPDKEENSVLESITITQFDHGTYSPPEISNTIVNPLEEAASLPKRQRRRKPSHGGVSL